MKREDKSSTEKLAVEEPIKPPPSVLNTRGEPHNNNNNNITNNRSEVGGAADVIQLDSELIISDVSLMNEIKENISPEHTITAATVVHQQQQQQMRPVLGESGSMRVKFQLGSTEDFDELLMAEDEELGGGGGDGESPPRGLASDDSCLSLEVEGGIGQIARDSMVIFNTSGGSSGSNGGGGGSAGGGGVVKASSPITSKSE